MLPAPVILAFNLPDAALNPLRALCRTLGLRLAPVPRESFTLPLGRMAGFPAAAPAAPGAAPWFDEAMLVLCGLDDAGLDRFLSMLRALPVPPIPLKAVLTPTNAAWSALELHEALARERGAVWRARNNPT